MAGDASSVPELDQQKYDSDEQVKIICLGDSAVGKSNRPQQVSTYALTLYKYATSVEDKSVVVDFWDTAGQERFLSMHPSYYHKATRLYHGFDVQRKITYKNLTSWYKELREYSRKFHVVLSPTKSTVTQKSFNFGKKQGLPFYFVSAANGTNVVKMFREMIKRAVDYKQNPSDFMDEVLQELENFELEKKEEAACDEGVKTDSPDLP
ncbi:hypothetical protein CRUP_030355 [Coryphaenoides rupestris]|nr:hypothetical protein CRUP_030355 [Coryphaenoides rupestris]